MTRNEKLMVKHAAYSVITMAGSYCRLTEKQIERSDGSSEQMLAIHESLRALNHVTVSMERLCRLLDCAETGKTEDVQCFPHSDKSVGTSLA